jgi:hypothetical protein
VKANSIDAITRITMVCQIIFLFITTPPRFFGLS